MYSYKVDISDYFNSVDIKTLLPILKDVLYDDELLFLFFKSLLENPFARKDEEIISPKKGIMAGVPISSFLANLYLKEMDEFFSQNNIPYMRYSDDIIVFADSESKIKEYSKTINEFLKKYKLIKRVKRRKK